MNHNMARNEHDAETEDFYVAQMSNGPIHICGKASGMAMHVSAAMMYSQEKLQALADRLQELNSDRVEDYIAALQVLA